MSIRAANNVFPHDPDDNWKQKLDRGGYEGTAKDLEDKINEIKNPDGILIAGSISKLGNVISIGETTFKCRIDNNVLTNIEDFSTTIVNANENYKRIDILVFTKFSTIIKIQGDEELESAKEPDVPPGTIKLAFISVFGSQINDPSQPILIPDISEKLDKGGFEGTAQDIVNSIPAPVDISVKLDKGGYNGTAADFLTKNTDQDVLGIKVFLAGKFGLRNIANTFTSFFSNSNTASRTYTLQNRSGTLLDNTDLANINSSLLTKQSVFSGVANYITKSLNSSSLVASRLFDSGTYFGIGTINEPIKDITLGNQQDRDIGIEYSSSVIRGKDLTVSGGKTVNYLLNPSFQYLFHHGSGGTCSDRYGNIYLQGFGVHALKIDNGTNVSYSIGYMGYCTNIAIGYSGSIFSQLINGALNAGGTGAGDNIITGLFSSRYSDKIYACYGGNIRVSTDNGVTFNIIQPGTFADGSMCEDFIGNVYALSNGVLWKQTGGTGLFVNTAIPMPGQFLTATPNNVIWSASTSALYRLEPLSTVYSLHYSFPDGLRNFRGISSDFNSRIFFISGLNQSLPQYVLETDNLGIPDLDGGMIKLKAGTGKGSGKSRCQIITGQKTVLGTDMQTETLRLEIDELGNIIVKTPKVYSNNSSAIAAGLPTGTLYWTLSGDMKIVV